MEFSQINRGNLHENVLPISNSRSLNLLAELIIKLQKLLYGLMNFTHKINAMCLAEAPGICTVYN